MIDFNKIKEAVKIRDEFLKHHPELQPLQEKINETLKKAGNNRHLRNILLQNMMLETWFQITRI